MAAYEISSYKEQEQDMKTPTEPGSTNPVVVAYWPEDRPNQFEMDDATCSFDGRCIRTLKSIFSSRLVSLFSTKLTTRHQVKLRLRSSLRGMLTWSFSVQMECVLSYHQNVKDSTTQLPAQGSPSSID